MTPELWDTVIKQIVPTLTAVGLGLRYLIEKAQVRVRTSTRISRSNGSAEYKDRVLALAQEEILRLESALAECREGKEP